jgi:hypothetical protein
MLHFRAHVKGHYFSELEFSGSPGTDLYWTDPRIKSIQLFKHYTDQRILGTILHVQDGQKRVNLAESHDRIY